MCSYYRTSRSSSIDQNSASLPQPIPFHIEAEEGGVHAVSGRDLRSEADLGLPEALAVPVEEDRRRAGRAEVLGEGRDGVEGCRDTLRAASGRVAPDRGRPFAGEGQQAVDH